VVSVKKASPEGVRYRVPRLAAWEWGSGARCIVPLRGGVWGQSGGEPDWKRAEKAYKSFQIVTIVTERTEGKCARVARINGARSLSGCSSSSPDCCYAREDSAPPSELFHTTALVSCTR
jgi:hypothetical protein